MKRIFQFTLVLLLFVASTTIVDAQKFGYLDSQSLLAQMPDVALAESKLEALQKQLQRKGEDMVKQLEVKYQDALTKAQRGELSPAEEERISQELQEGQAKILRFEQQMQTDLLTKRNELLEPIVNKVNTAIQDVGKEQGYKMIFDTSAGALLYAVEADDVTALVRAKLGI